MADEGLHLVIRQAFYFSTKETSELTALLVSVTPSISPLYQAGESVRFAFSASTQSVSMNAGLQHSPQIVSVDFCGQRPFEIYPAATSQVHRGWVVPA